MTVKERILMIRLMESMEKYPAYAKALGIEATGVRTNQNRNQERKGLTAV